MRERNPKLHRKRVSASLTGKIGEDSRRWKGLEAGYVAKHMWIKKHYGKASLCEIDQSHKAKRYEWSNISGKYFRTKSDYRQLCPSCHRKLDHGNFCRKGHEYTPQNTAIRKEGWRVCKICRRETLRRFKNAKTN
jgi:hypothetical protein